MPSRPNPTARSVRDVTEPRLPLLDHSHRVRLGRSHVRSAPAHRQPYGHGVPAIREVPALDEWA
ncbi:hypothetical protein SALBM311S_09076 [Streptomyces alboniger]